LNYKKIYDEAKNKWAKGISEAKAQEEAALENAGQPDLMKTETSLMDMSVAQDGEI